MPKKTPSVRLWAILALIVGGSLSGHGQDSVLPFSSSASLHSGDTLGAVLPEAPSAMLTEPAEVTEDAGGFVPLETAGKYRRVIQADQQAVALSAGDKLALSVRNQLTLGNLAANLASAGISHWNDSRPHYGVDRGAFGERLGATSLKGLTQSVFSYGIYAAIFHDDPRYYVLGDGHSFKNRAVYAATRIVITKKDDGSSATNWARLAGITSAAALANAYYPDRDRSVGRTATSALTSIAVGAAVNELNEFAGDIKKKLRHKK